MSEHKSYEFKIKVRDSRVIEGERVTWIILTPPPDFHIGRLHFPLQEGEERSFTLSTEPRKQDPELAELLRHKGMAGDAK